MDSGSNKKSKKKKKEVINKQPNYMNSTMSQQEFKTEEEYKMQLEKNKKMLH